MSQDTISQQFQQRIKEAREQQLSELDLSNDWNANDSQKLTQIPNEVFELTYLKKLNLRYNNIKKIPSEIARLTNLQYLDLIGNEKITEFCDELIKLPSLIFLRLTWNLNTSTPEWFSQIRQLGIHLVNKDKEESYSIIEAIPDDIVNLENLVFLKIWLNFSEDFLPWLKTLEKLELYLSRNRLSDLPESITNLSNLTTLDLSGNRLKNLPESITKLSNLTKLYLSENRLSNLPESITKLSNLTILNLNENGLNN